MSLVTQLEKCLIAGFPFIFWLIEYADANPNEHVDENGVFVDPPNDILDVKGVTIGPDPIGGHAILCVGCDQQENRFLINDSYSPDWGRRADEGWPGETWGKKDPTMAGHFWLPYSWFKENISDIWVIDATEVQAPGWETHTLILGRHVKRHDISTACEKGHKRFQRDEARSMDRDSDLPELTSTDPSNSHCHKTQANKLEQILK